MRKGKIVDKVMGRIKCPAITCRSADVQPIGKTLLGATKYQCRKCGRTFKA